MKKTKWFIALLIVLFVGGCGDSRSKRVDSEEAEVVDSVLTDTLGEDSIVPSAEDSLIESLLSRKLPSFSRYEFKDSIKIMDDYTKGTATYELTVDFPNSSVRNASAIRRWLAMKITNSPMTVKRQGFSIYDNREITQYAAENYYSGIKELYDWELSTEESTDSIEIQSDLFQVVELQAKVCTARFVTYTDYISDYGGGIHEHYAESFISFDHVHQQEIDNDYLFLPSYRDEVLSILLEEAKKTLQYKRWSPTLVEYVNQEDFSLPTPGLYEDGVVFSFQPYEISCFAAGVFHFPVPYSRIRHCLTPQAMWCIGLTD